MTDSASRSCVDRTRPHLLEPRSSAVLIARDSVGGFGDPPIAPAAVATGRIFRTSTAGGWADRLELAGRPDS